MIAVILSTVALASVGNTTPGLLGSAIAQEQKFMATLSGQEEVPPTESQATGMAEFTVMGADSVAYTVNASDIQGVTAGHIHSGKQGENGPVVVTLFKYDSPMDQVSETGSITADKLEGPMAGKQLSDLASTMSSGDTYVNIHTGQNPDGEIRGQISSSGSGAMMPGNSTGQ